MKQTALTLAFLLMSTPAFAQFGQILKRAEQVKKVSEMDISDKDQRAIGDQVSAKLIDRFGIYQDPAVTKYVTLVGSVLAQGSAKPQYDWQFIVLDTEAVNAYAAPGGIVHITKGALGLIKDEAQLAGVLGHEIIHITEKHTVRAIQKSKGFDVVSDEVGAQGGLAGSLVNRLADAAFNNILMGAYNRGDENESDEDGVVLANKVGYAPNGLHLFLTKIAERNAGNKDERNGFFASHPELKERLDKIAKVIKDQKLTATATVQARYAGTIKFDAKPVTEIAELEDGARGVVGGGSSSNAKEEKKEEEKPKKKGFGLGSVTSSLAGGGKQQESTQASASAGARGVGPDTSAVGGSNKNRVKVTINATEIAEFKKGIA
jgi:predicted Zn-dependent protease